MRVRIDFSGKRPPPRWGSIVLLLLGLGAVVPAAWQYYDAYRHQEAAGVAYAEARARHARLPTAVPTQSVAAANRIIRELNLPWQALLSALEAQLSDDIALLSVEPDAESRRLRLQAEAKSADRMLDFVGALKADSHFVSAKLQRHEVNESDRNRPYRFTMELEWSAEL